MTDQFLTTHETVQFTTGEVSALQWPGVNRELHNFSRAYGDQIEIKVEHGPVYVIHTTSFCKAYFAESIQEWFDELAGELAELGITCTRLSDNEHDPDQMGPKPRYFGPHADERYAQDAVDGLAESCRQVVAHNEHITLKMAVNVLVQVIEVVNIMLAVMVRDGKV